MNKWKPGVVKRMATKVRLPSMKKLLFAVMGEIIKIWKQAFIKKK